MVKEWNETATVYPRDICVHELFEQRAARYPDAIAVADGINQLSYAELNRRANRPLACILNPALELVPPGVSASCVWEATARLAAIGH
jgi:non-ribosomal peptide synthetase component F